MRSSVCCRVRLVTSNQRRMIASAPKAPGSKDRSTHDQPNFAAGRFRKFCFPEITPRSQSGAKSTRSSAHARIAQIYSAEDGGRHNSKRGLQGAFFSEHLMRLIANSSHYDARVNPAEAK